MPKVPLLQQQTNLRPIATPYEDAPRNNALQIVGESVEKFGGQVQHVGGQVEKIQAEEREKAKLAKGAEFRQALSKWQEVNVYDSDPNGKGFLAKKRKNAMGEPGGPPLAEQYLQDFQKYAKDVGQKLATSEEEKQALSQIYDREREVTGKELQGHERREREAHETETFEADVSTTLGRAANYAGRPEMAKEFATERELGEQAILQHARARGWGKDVIERRLTEYRTQLHLSVLKKLTDPDAGSPAQAEAYLKAHGDEMDGVMREKSNVDEHVAKAGLRARSFAKADEIVAKVGALNVGGQMEELGKIEDPTLREAVQGKLGQQFSLANHAKTERLKQTYGRVRTQVEQSVGFLDETRPDFLDLDDDGQADARAYARKVRYELSQGTPGDRKAVDEESRIAREAFNKLANDDPQAALKVDVGATYSRASRVAQAEIETVKSKLDKTIREGKFSTRTEVRDLITGSTKGLKKETAAVIEAKMWDFWANHESRPTDAEAKAKLAELTRIYLIERFILPDKERRGAELSNEERAKARPKDGAAPVATPAPAPADTVMVIPPGKTTAVPVHRSRLEGALKSGGKLADGKGDFAL